MGDTTDQNVTPPPAAPAAPAAPPVEDKIPATPAPAEDGSKTPEGTAAPFEVKLPEGYEADAGLLGVLKETAKDSASGQKLVDTFLAFQKQSVEKAKTEFEQQNQRWIDEFKASPDFKENEAAAGRAMAQFGSPELRKFMDDSGYGNHPQVVQLLVSVGKALAEDNVAGTGAGPAGNASDKNPMLGLYTHPTSAKS